MGSGKLSGKLNESLTAGGVFGMNWYPKPGGGVGGGRVIPHYS